MLGVYTYPLWEFHIRFPKYHHPGGGMSPEGCSSLTLRSPEGDCWRAYGKSEGTTFRVYWSLSSRKDPGTPTLRLSRRGQDEAGILR